MGWDINLWMASASERRGQRTYTRCYLASGGREALGDCITVDGLNVSTPPKFICGNPTPQCSGRQLGHEGGTFVNGIIALIRHGELAPSLSPLPTV